MSKRHPSDILREDAVSYDQQTGLLTIDYKKTNIPFLLPPKVWYPNIPETKGFGSMEPAFGMGNNNVLIAGNNEVDQGIMVDWLFSQTIGGFQNVAVYKSGQYYAVHRIVQCGEDTQGRYFRFMGDNNNPFKIGFLDSLFYDPPLVRFNEILWLVASTNN